MSHFTVLVIGENPEEQLAPYGLDNFFRDCSDEKDDIEKTYEEHKKEYESYEEFLDYYGYVIENGIIGRYCCENPKWDWYVLGGRWTGFFTLKNGSNGKVGKPGIQTSPAKKGFADQAKWGDIDAEFMREKVALIAKEEYELVENMFDGKIPQLECTWKDILNNEMIGSDQKRSVYTGQKSVIEFQEKAKKYPDTLGYFSSLDDYQISKEEFIQNAKESAFSTYAVLKDGQWFSKGEMGWFGMSNDILSDKEWNTKINQLLSELDSETLVSVYDCHI